MKQLKNDLLLRAIAGDIVERPPVWMMRQAGRYLPDFRKLKEKYDFFHRVRDPEMASDITIMPVDQIGVDAAILFSDILVVPQAMGVTINMVEDRGPVISEAISTLRQIANLKIDGIVDRLSYVMDGIKLTLEKLDGRVPLIGFAGAPWTIFCYLVEGSGSKNFERARAFCFAHPDLSHKLLEKITDATILYLKAKVDAGVDVIQLFDSWAGLLSPSDYETFSNRYNRRIVDDLSRNVPFVLFAKGGTQLLPSVSDTKADVLGLDWTVPADVARSFAGNKILQGNFDPAKLLGTPELVRSEVRKMVQEFGQQRYIANLGHGILPHTPVENAKAFVESVKEFALEKV